MPGACQLDSLQLLCGSDIYNFGTFHNARIFACHTSVSELESTFVNNYAGNTPVAALALDSLVLRWQNDQWQSLVFNYPFAYNGSDNLILEYRWQGDDGNSAYDRGFYTTGNRACDARSSTIPKGTPRNYMPRMRLFYAVTGIGVGSVELPRVQSGIQAFPNPFRDRVTISIASAAGRQSREISICDALGRQVWQQRLTARSRTLAVEWDGRATNGTRLPPGVYLATTDANPRIAERIRLTR